MAATKVYERTETGTTCGNRWKFSKLAGDVCVQDRGHRGTHQNTRVREAHTFSWFDSEGIPSEGTVTTVDRAAGLAEINAAMIGEAKRAVRTMSSISRTDYAIEYKDGRSVRLVLVDAPEAPAAEDEPTGNVVSMRGGKVHSSTPGAPKGHAFPLCRTGGSTNRGTRYRTVNAPLTCSTCLTYEQRRQAARTAQ
jgi:hypothetical protein